jgi:hypothetical protein
VLLVMLPSSDGGYPKSHVDALLNTETTHT